MMTFIVHGSINVNAQWAEEKVIMIKIKKKKTMVQIHSENMWVCGRPRNAANQAASLIVCGRPFQSLGAELEKTFLVALGIRRHGCDVERMGCAGTSAIHYLLYLCTTILSPSQQRIMNGWWLMDQLARPVVL